MKIKQIHLFNKTTSSIEVFIADDIPDDHQLYKLFAIYLEDGTVISC